MMSCKCLEPSIESVGLTHDCLQKDLYSTNALCAREQAMRLAGAAAVTASANGISVLLAHDEQDYSWGLEGTLRKEVAADVRSVRECRQVLDALSGARVPHLI